MRPQEMEEIVGEDIMWLGKDSRNFELKEHKKTVSTTDYRILRKFNRVLVRQRGVRCSVLST